MPGGAGGRVILASGSPRRRELLTSLGVPFEVVVSGADEDNPETDPQRLAGELALLKDAGIEVDTVFVEPAPAGTATLMSRTRAPITGKCLSNTVRFNHMNPPPRSL
jgi:DNA-binding IclR family transcriptional regulator